MTLLLVVKLSERRSCDERWQESGEGATLKVRGSVAVCGSFLSKIVVPRVRVGTGRR